MVSHLFVYFAIDISLVQTLTIQNEYRVQIGERSCPMILDSDITLIDYWSGGTVNCTSPDVTAGLYNVSINVFDPSLGLGNAVPDASVVWQAQNRLFLSELFGHNISADPTL